MNSYFLFVYAHFRISTRLLPVATQLLPVFTFAPSGASLLSLLHLICKRFCPPHPRLCCSPTLSPRSFSSSLIYFLWIQPQAKTRPLLANDRVNFHMHYFHTLFATGCVAAHHTPRRLSDTRPAHMDAWRRCRLLAPARG